MWLKGTMIHYLLAPTMPPPCRQVFAPVTREAVVKALAHWLLESHEGFDKRVACALPAHCVARLCPLPLRICTCTPSRALCPACALCGAAT